MVTASRLRILVRGKESVMDLEKESRKIRIVFLSVLKRKRSRLLCRRFGSGTLGWHATAAKAETKRAADNNQRLLTLKKATDSKKAIHPALPWPEWCAPVSAIGSGEFSRS